MTKQSDHPARKRREPRESDVFALLDRKYRMFKSLLAGNNQALELMTDLERLMYGGHSFTQDQALELAGVLGVKRLNCLLGIAPPTGHRQVRETLVANLSHAAEQAERHGITLLIEPLNGIENPGYYLTRTRQAIEVLDDVGSANLKLLYDVYHQQISEGDLARTLEKFLPRIGHVQIACPPGRHQPGAGEVDIGWLLGHLDRIGYDGWVGCEYVPTGTTQDSLAWAKDWLG